MTLAELIPLAINVSMGLVVLALGLHASLREAGYLLRRPGLLVRSVVSMNVIMPVLAAVAVALLELHPAIEIAIVAIAFSPVPPILPPKQAKAGGEHGYVISLLVIAAALAIVVVPIGVHVTSRAFGLGGDVPPEPVAQVVLITVIVPLVTGMVVHQLAPGFATRVARPLSLVGVALLVVACVPVLIGSWPLLVSMVGNGTLVALAIFTLAGVAVGHALGGPDPDERSVLALATGTRHPGVALAIAGATFPDEKAVLAVVLWHLVVGGIVSGPYVSWRKRAHAANTGSVVR